MRRSGFYPIAIAIACRRQFLSTDLPPPQRDPYGPGEARGASIDGRNHSSTAAPRRAHRWPARAPSRRRTVPPVTDARPVVFVIDLAGRRKPLHGHARRPGRPSGGARLQSSGLTAASEITPCKPWYSAAATNIGSAATCVRQSGSHRPGYAHPTFNRQEVSPC
jgi:hypothetical protein